MPFAELLELLDPDPHGAALNMAIDEVLLRQASQPLLRVYRWANPAASFGYFQRIAGIEDRWPRRELVRRWTGGGVVPHGEDLTYTLIVPRHCSFFRRNPLEAYRAIHESIAMLLEASSVHLAGSAAEKRSNACFENPARHDVILGGQKVAGAAQRRTELGLLHQGSIQLRPQRPEIRDGLAAVLGRSVRRCELAVETLALAHRLANEKYATAAWLRRF
ncbi:MAG: hypothetical protein M3463_19315 [Verrucomicrobiota bacterium]|nr:hypothetical protein [Verrucomicrobiota bacterium]